MGDTIATQEDARLNMTALEAIAADIAKLRGEIAAAWSTLECAGFPPEACGWHQGRNMTGVLPEAIGCALDCLIRQREDLLREVVELRKLREGSGKCGL